MERNTEQEVDFQGIIEGIRPDAPPSLSRQKEKEPVQQGQETEAENSPRKQRTIKAKPVNAPSDRKVDESPEDFFLSHFIDTPPMKTVARQGKMVYMRPEYHERIQRIISVIGNNQLNISTYIDNILAYHFEEFEEPIRKLYSKNYRDVY